MYSTPMRVIPSCPKYAATFCGKVVPIQTAAGRPIFRVLRQYRDKPKPGRNPGRNRKWVRPSIDGRSRKRYTSILVAEAWIGPHPGPGYEVDHINDNPMLNAASNLQYLTRVENVLKSQQEVEDEQPFV